MNNKGFTLLELIVVLIVMAALVAIALPQYAGFVERAKASEAITAIGAIKMAEEATRLQTGDYTSNINALGLNLANATWNYGVVATGGTSFVATATRNGGGTGISGTIINLNYTNAGVSTWNGTHPGAPKS
jgi:prepilin-type N-terminal cleavage/methylation domain-containing protein